MQKQFIGVSVSAALIGALALSVPAKAADLRDDHVYHGSYKDAPAYAAPTNWGGFYVGGHLGASWTSGNASLNSTNCYFNEVALMVAETQEPSYTCRDSSNRVDLGDTSLIGGVHAGFNVQRGAVVFGVEGDVSFADHIDYLASVRGRLGFAADNWLFYGTGGVAFIGGGFSGTISDNNISGVPFDTHDDQVGFVVGGGVEVKVAPNWSIGVEGLYYGFDGATQHTSGTVGPWYDYTDYDMKANGISDVTVVRGRLSYHVNRDYEPLK